MKIFVIEDELASIESAKMQLGKDHELIFFTTAMEVFRKLLEPQKIEEQKPDIILTDVNIPMGDPDCYSVKDHYFPSDMIPAGLVVAIRAVQLSVPCVIITDSNSHRDMIGLLLNHARFNSGREKFPQMIYADTRPDRIDTPVGQGKDWLGSLWSYRNVEEMVKHLTTPKKTYEEIRAEEESS